MPARISHIDQSNINCCRSHEIVSIHFRMCWRFAFVYLVGLKGWNLHRQPSETINKLLTQSTNSNMWTRKTVAISHHFLRPSLDSLPTRNADRIQSISRHRFDQSQKQQPRWYRRQLAQNCFCPSSSATSVAHHSSNTGQISPYRRRNAESAMRWYSPVTL